MGQANLCCAWRVFVFKMFCGFNSHLVIFPTIPVESSLLRSVLLSQLDAIVKTGINTKVVLTSLMSLSNISLSHHYEKVCRSDWYLSNNSC